MSPIAGFLSRPSKQFFLAQVEQSTTGKGFHHIFGRDYVLLMSEKKTSNIGFKVSESEKKEFEENAEYFNLENPAQLFRQLNRACSEIRLRRRQHVHPIQINYYPPGTKTAQDEIEPK